MTLKKLLARPRRATVAAVLTLALVGVYVMVSGPADLGRRRQTTSESSEEASTMQPIGSKDWEDDQDQTVPSYQDWYEEEAVVFGQLEDREIRVDHEMFYFVVDRDDLTKGQACVVESAAKLHPHRRIFVLFNREKVKDVLQSPTMSVLLTLGNVWFRYIDPENYMVQPEARSWLRTSGFQKSPFSAALLETALTYAILKTYGGTALSFDYLLLRPITGRGEFLARCHSEVIEAQPISLRTRHPVLVEALSSLGRSFDPMDPASIGPDLLTAVLKKECKVKTVREVKYKDCARVSSASIWPPGHICPIPSFKRDSLLQASHIKFVRKKIEENESLAIRIWGHQGQWGNSTAPTPLHTLALESCPMVKEVFPDF